MKSLKQLLFIANILLKYRLSVELDIGKQEDDIKNHPNGGWLWLECPEFSSLHHKYVYQLVTDTWLGPNPGNKKNGYYERHHINNNGYYNRVDNLICLTYEEHRKIPRPSKLRDN